MTAPLLLFALTLSSTTSGQAHAPVDLVWSPIGDGAALSLSLGFGLLSEAIIGTGELQPQAPGDPNLLLGIDRGVALSNESESSARIFSDLGIALALGYAATDIVMEAILDRDSASALTYGWIYAETLSFNLALGNLAKIAVRRPRPRAYRAAREGRVLTGTDNSLSFYSLHTAMTAGLAATGAYLAFHRDSEVEAWVVLGVGAAITAFVGIQRVRAQAHFPTDVIAGAMAGAGIGLLVPWMHEQRSVSLSASPLESGGALVLFTLPLQ